MDRVRKGAEHQDEKRAGNKHGFEDPLICWADLAVELLAPTVSPARSFSVSVGLTCAGEKCSLGMLLRRPQDT